LSGCFYFVETEANIQAKIPATEGSSATGQDESLLEKVPEVGIHSWARPSALLENPFHLFKLALLEHCNQGFLWLEFRGLL
jgi:hypothetical protein